MNTGQMPPILASMRTTTVQNPTTEPTDHIDFLKQDHGMQLQGSSPTSPGLDIVNPFQTREKLPLNTQDAFVTQKTQSDTLNLQLDSVLDAFRKTLRESAIPEKTTTTSPDDPVEDHEVLLPTAATEETIHRFLGEGAVVLQEHAELAQKFFSSFTDCAQPMVLLYLKLVYFKSQADIFTVSLQHSLNKLIPDIYAQMKMRIVNCLSAKTEKMQKFASTYPVDHYEKFAYSTVTEAHKALRRQCKGCDQRQTQEAYRLLKLKEHLHVQTVKAWQEFFDRYKRQLITSLQSLQTQYSMLTMEYSLIVQKVVELAPRTTDAAVNEFFPGPGTELDLNTIDQVVKVPHGLISLEPLIDDKGPILVCKYLRLKNEPCQSVTLTPEQLIPMRVIFKKFAQLYQEYVNKLLQLDVRENLDFTALLGVLNTDLTRARVNFNKVQLKLNSLICTVLQSVPGVQPYLKGLDQLYAVEILKLAQKQQEEQLECITDFMNKDLIFLHF